MKMISTFFKRFWSSDTSLTVLLTFLVILIFLVYPVYGISYVRLIITILFSLILVSGVSMVLKKPRLGIAVGIFVFLCILINGLELFFPDALALWATLFNFICCGLLVIIILSMVFREAHITLNHVLGAVAAYLLLGLMWAFLYQAVALLSPEAFKRASIVGVDSINALQKDLIYYSFVTITTVGYGDIVPVHPFARMLAMIEALIGQLFPAILLARLVAIEILHSKGQ